MNKQLTVTDARGNVAMVIDRVAWEIGELEYEERELSEKLKIVRRDLRQLRDMQSMEGR